MRGFGLDLLALGIEFWYAGSVGGEGRRRGGKGDWVVGLFLEFSSY